MSDIEEDEVLLLDNQKSKKNSNFHIIKTGTIIILSTVLIITVIHIITARVPDINDNAYLKAELKNETNIDLPFGFVFVDENADHGPITIDREKDDGTKLNIYDFIHPEDLSFYYNQEEFDELEEVIKYNETNYFCEYDTDLPPEAYKGYEIECPAHYTIKIDYAFYGRHAYDTKHCKKNIKGEKN